MLKRELFSLPIEQLQDVQLIGMYKDIVGAYVDKIEMLKSLGTDKFLYNVVRYFGKPDPSLIKLAQFILAFPESKQDKEPVYSAKESIPFFKEFIQAHGINCKVEMSTKLVAKAMVSNSKKTLYVNSGGFFSKSEMKRLIHHEIGVHMFTTINANNQKLKLFSLGLPLNTETQEGLALYAEYCTGALSVTRLKELAIRVLAVDSMINESDFKTTFMMLVDDCHLDREKAFNLCTRVYRGGGFTKDMLYLSGFKKVLHHFNENGLSEELFIGKTSLDNLTEIKDLVKKDWATAPQIIDPIFNENPHDKYDNEVKYLVSAIINF